jgi:hypothetical protein
VETLGFHTRLIGLSAAGMSATLHPLLTSLATKRVCWRGVVCQPSGILVPLDGVPSLDAVPPRWRGQKPDVVIG